MSANGSTYRYPFPPFPNGWYCIAFSDELAPGQILNRTFMGQEIVVFRTSSGNVAVSDAHCPHMGGHLAHGGTIEDETIRCPFHGFCFDTQGQCVKTGYDTKPPPKAILRIWPSREMHGLVLVFYDTDGAAPTWEVPSLDTAQWSPLTYNVFRVKSHPQETTENSVDFGHFSIVHGYSDTEQLSDLNIDGPLLNCRYAMRRPADVFLAGNSLIRAEFEVFVWGLGYSLVDVWVEKYNLRSRVWVLPAPIDGDYINIRAAVSIETSVKPTDIHWGLGLMPAKWAMSLVQKMTLKGYCNDLSQDFDIWTHKSYIEPAVLAKGDGPIATYRKYAQQFYGQPENPSS